jgi:hypothetical protein
VRNADNVGSLEMSCETARSSENPVDVRRHRHHGR